MSAEKYPTIFSRQTKAIVYTFLSLISIDLVIKKLQENKKVKHIRKYDKHSMESLNSNFGCTDWRKCKNNEDPNVCYSSRYKKLTEIRRYATTVSHLKKLDANPKISSSGLLEAYLYQIKERIYFINLILSLLILQTKRNLLHIELSQFTI